MTEAASALLTLNAGSSSVKFTVFGLGGNLPELMRGRISDIGGAAAFDVHTATESDTFPVADTLSLDAAMLYVLDWLDGHAPAPIAAVAHRVVHGGSEFTHSVTLDAHVLEALQRLSPLAPQHQPHNLAGVDAVCAARPHLPQYACFDTAFHAGHGPLATVLPLPAKVTRHGVRRYGFHGLSYAWIAHWLRENQPSLCSGRVVAAHLGNGASLCAMKDGQSIDSTMGFTALDGLPMGTRCGAIDPGVVLHMLHGLNMPLRGVERILYEESGLKGLSGISNDVHVLLETGGSRAALALDYFAYRTAQHVAAMATTIGGIDGLVFTGGIGENAGEVREAVLHRLAFLRPFEVHVIPANEERAMAMDVWERFLDPSV